MPRPKGGADLLQDRRRRALAFVDSGCSLNEAAHRIGGGASSVMRRYHGRRRGGEQGLRVRFSPGRPHKLKASQEPRLIKLLLKGPLARGYRTNLWTTKRIALLIEEEFGVRYHPNHIGRFMHGLQWSPQKPERRVVERDEKEVEQWKRQPWPRIKKSRSAGRPHSVRR
jgi:transposase